MPRLQRVVVGAADGDDLLEERVAVAVLRVRERHRSCCLVSMMPWLRLRSRRPLRVRLPTYSTAATMFVGELEFRADAELVDDRRVLIGVLDAPLHDRGIDRRGLSGVKPCVKVNAGASCRVLAEIDASTSCGRLSPSWLSLPVAIGLLVEDAVAAAHHHVGRLTLQATPTRGAMSLRSGWISARSKTLPSCACTIGRSPGRCWSAGCCGRAAA